MVHVAITGAAGNVGRVLLDAFEDHELTALTYEDESDIDGVVCDITDRERFIDALSGREIDVLIHLAGNPSAYAEWDDLAEPNIEGVYNAYHAAVANDLDRVVYASSNHAVNMAGIDDSDEPETAIENAPVIDEDAPPRPDSFYGVTKVAGEAIGNYYARRGDIETVNARIGWLMTRSELADSQNEGTMNVDTNPNAADPDEAARFARAMWLSHADCGRAFRAAATASIPESPLTVHAISRNDDRYLALTRTLRSIGYRPRDDSAEELS
jgi:L-arabinose 1-dehydrogenase [NAD(P)+]